MRIGHDGDLREAHPRPPAPAGEQEPPPAGPASTAEGPGPDRAATGGALRRGLLIAGVGGGAVALLHVADRHNAERAAERARESTTVPSSGFDRQPEGGQPGGAPATAPTTAKPAPATTATTTRVRRSCSKATGSGRSSSVLIRTRSSPGSPCAGAPPTATAAGSPPAPPPTAPAPATPSGGQLAGFHGPVLRRRHTPGPGRHPALLHLGVPGRRPRPSGPRPGRQPPAAQDRQRHFGRGHRPGPQVGLRRSAGAVRRAARRPPVRRPDVRGRPVRLGDQPRSRRNRPHRS